MPWARPIPLSGWGPYAFLNNASCSSSQGQAAFRPWELPSVASNAVNYNASDSMMRHSAQDSEWPAFPGVAMPIYITLPTTLSRKNASATIGVSATPIDQGASRKRSLDEEEGVPENTCSLPMPDSRPSKRPSIKATERTEESPSKACYQCEWCSTVLTTETDLKIHVQIQHKNRNQEECPVCRKFSRLFRYHVEFLD